MTALDKMTWIRNKEMGGVNGTEIIRSSDIMAHIYIQFKDAQNRKTKDRLHPEKETMPMRRSAEFPNDIHRSGTGWKGKKITITASYLKAQKAHWKNKHMVAKWKQPMRHDESLHSWWPLSSAITGNPAQTTPTNTALLVSMKKWVWKHEKMCLQSYTRIGMSE